MNAKTDPLEIIGERMKRLEKSIERDQNSARFYLGLALLPLICLGVFFYLTGFWSLSPESIVASSIFCLFTSWAFYLNAPKVDGLVQSERHLENLKLVFVVLSDEPVPNEVLYFAIFGSTPRKLLERDSSKATQT